VTVRTPVRSPVQPVPQTSPARAERQEDRALNFDVGRLLGL
jgi:hypothetical protein